MRRPPRRPLATIVRGRGPSWEIPPGVPPSRTSHGAGRHLSCRRHAVVDAATTSRLGFARGRGRPHGLYGSVVLLSSASVGEGRARGRPRRPPHRLTRSGPRPSPSSGARPARPVPPDPESPIVSAHPRSRPLHRPPRPALRRRRVGRWSWRSPSCSACPGSSRSSASTCWSRPPSAPACSSPAAPGRSSARRSVSAPRSPSTSTRRASRRRSAARSSRSPRSPSSWACRSSAGC